MKGYFLLFTLATLIISACGPKKNKNDEPTNPGSSALLKKFTTVKVPYLLKDSLIEKDDNVKDAIAWADFTKEVPDTIFKSEFGADVKPKLYPIAIHFNDDDAEYYVFVKAVDGDKKVGYILCFDGMELFKDAMPVVYADYDNKTKFYATLTKNYAIDQIKEQIDNKNELLIYRITYIYNNAGFFQTVLTTDNDDNSGEAVYSPIDTLPKTNKFCGDYGDAKNIISIRNGKTETDYTIFVHTEAGELKGNARLIAGDTLRYSKAGDMCQLDLAISKKYVTLSENVACRNHTKSNTEFKGKYELIEKVKETAPKLTEEELKKLLRPTNTVKPKTYVPESFDSLRKKAVEVKPRPVKRDSLGNIIDEPKPREPKTGDNTDDPAGLLNDDKKPKPVIKDTTKSGGK
jgi:hypothetical protein